MIAIILIFFLVVRKKASPSTLSDIFRARQFIFRSLRHLLIVELMINEKPQYSALNRFDDRFQSLVESSFGF